MANKLFNSSFELGEAGCTLTDTPLHMRDFVVAGGHHGAKRLEITTGTGYRFLPFVWMEVEEHQVSWWEIATEANTAGYAIIQHYAEPVFTFYTAPSVWTRKVVSFTPGAAGYYQLVFGHNQPTMTHYVDDVQIEVGAAPTDYAPKAVVELGLVTDAPYNTFFDGDTKQFKVNWWNDGVETTKLLIYEVFDSRTNEKLVANSQSVLLPANAATTTTIALPARNGSLRIMARIGDTDDSSHELPVCVIPAAAESGVNVNGTFGGHTEANVAQIAFLRSLGISHARTLSPVKPFRWVEREVTEGVFNWLDDTVTALASGGMNVLGIIHGGLDKTGGPDWAHNPDNSLRLDRWALFCETVVARYKHQVTYWELWNEPLQSGDDGTPQAIWISIAANYAAMVNAAVPVIIAEDPTAQIVIMGGVPDEEWAEDVWDLLDAGVKTAVRAVSNHLYPRDNGVDLAGDQNLPEFDPRPSEWGAKKAAMGGKEIWNSECATWNRGALRGLHAIDGYRYAAGGDEWDRDEGQSRSFASVDRITREILLCLMNAGVGGRAFQYDHRNVSLQQRSSTTTGGWEYTKTPRPTLASVAIMSSFVDGYTSVAKLVNAEAASLTMGVFESGGRRVVAAWDYNRGNLELSVGGADITVYDVMGNAITQPTGKVRISKSPQYIASNTLTVAQMTDLLEDAAVAMIPDLHPPRLSIDIVQRDSGDGDGLLKWSATDATRINTAATTERILYRHRLDAEAWSAWSSATLARPVISAGAHTLTVQAKDEDGNISEASFVFDNATAAAPVNVTYPSTSGTEQVDEVLLMDPGSATGVADPVHRMAWLRKLP